jgi:hypothetical protein
MQITEEEYRHVTRVLAELERKQQEQERTHEQALRQLREQIAELRREVQPVWQRKQRRA